MEKVERGCPVGGVGLAVGGGDDLEWCVEFIWWLEGGGMMLCCVSAELV